MSLPETLKRLRENAGLSQYQLANQIGVDQKLICFYEKGLRTPSLPTAVQLANVLHCSLDELVGRTELSAE